MIWSGFRRTTTLLSVAVLVHAALNSTALVAGGLAGAPAPAQSGGPSPAPGQSKGARETPGADNPEVAFMFLLHHHALMAEVHKLVAAGSGELDGAERDAAASMSLGVADFRAIGAIYSQVSALLQSVDNEADAYRDHVLSSGIAADMGILHRFNDRKTAVKASIKRRLQASLSGQGWAALEGYIEGPFREGVHMLRPQ